MDKPQTARRTRSDKGRITLTPRDAAILLWVGEQYAVRLDQLAQLLGRHAQRTTQQAGVVQLTTVRRVVHRWLTCGMVRSKYLLAGEPPWVYLTGKGLHELGLPFRELAPIVALAAHYYWTNQVRLWVEQHYHDDRWVSERWLLKERGETDILRPTVADGEVQRSDPSGEVISIAVEVELTVKEAGRLHSILAARADHYDGVWYFTTPATHRTLQRQLDRFDPEVQRRFRLRHLADLV